MEESKRKERPEAIVRLEKVWPDLDKERRMKLEAVAMVLDLMVSNEKEAKEATA